MPKSFNQWLSVKEGPLDDPEHALFGDFDHIPWLKKDIQNYSKLRSQKGQTTNPYGSTIIWKKGKNDPADALQTYDTDTAGNDPTQCMKRIQQLEKRLQDVESILQTQSK